MEELKVFASRVKELRLRFNLSQRQMAERVGVTAATLSAYETNIKNPSLGITKKIATEFDVSLDWLCGIDNQGNKRKYTNIIKVLIELSNIDGITLEIKEQSSIYDLGIYFDDFEINRFIKEWKDVKNLYDNNKIDKDVYDFWIEATLKKYDYNIGEPCF